MNQLDLYQNLALLEQAQLLRPLHEGEPEYIFKHALVQDAAYATLLKQHRRQLHKRIGEELERANSQDLEQFAPVLGYHFSEAGDFRRAAKFFIMAGDSAQRLFAPAEARSHYDNALADVARVPESQDIFRQRIVATTGYAMVAFGSDPPEQILARLTEVESLARKLESVTGTSDREDRRTVARLHFWIGRLLNITNQPVKAIEYHQQVLDESRDLGDEELVAIPSGEIGLGLARQGYYGKAIPLLLPGIAYLEKTANWQHWTYLVAHLAISLVGRGEVAAGLARAEEIMQRAEQLDSRSAIAVCHLFNSFIYMLGGEPDKSLAASTPYVEMARETGELLLVNMAYGFRAWAESRLGRLDAAAKSLGLQEETAKQLGGQFILPDQFAAIAAEVALRRGSTEKALALAKGAVELARQQRGIFAEGLGERIGAQALAAGSPSRHEEIEQHLTSSMNAFESGECLVEIARTLVVWGSLASGWGNLTLAKEQFEKGTEQFEAAGLTRELTEARGLLAALGASKGT